MLSGSDGIGPLPSGSPAEAGEGCPRHVVVLWPPTVSPSPALPKSGLTHRNSLRHHLLRQMWPILDRISMALGLCKLATQPSPTSAHFRVPIQDHHTCNLSSLLAVFLFHISPATVDVYIVHRDPLRHLQTAGVLSMVILR